MININKEEIGMNRTFHIVDEVSKNVNAYKVMTTKIEYHCDSEKDAKQIQKNITKVMTKNLDDVALAKITYDYHAADRIVEVVIDEHVKTSEDMKF